MDLRYLRRLLCVGCFFLVFTSSLEGAEITVTAVSDGIVADNRCTLREAIEAANTDSAFMGCDPGLGHDTILFVLESTYAITVAGGNEDDNLTGDFDIRDDVTLRPAAGLTATISGSDLDRVFDVHEGADLTIEGLTVEQGDGVTSGGGIQTRELASKLRLISARIESNRSTLFGGGLYLAGPAWITDSVIAFNQSLTGAGVTAVSAAPLVLLRTVVDGNLATSDGGGLSVIAMTARDSAIIANQAGRHGGGIEWRNEGSAASRSELINTTLAENAAEADGGGLYFDGPGDVALYSTTVAWNYADYDENGSGDGGGFHVADGSGNLILRNTLVAQNEDLSMGPSPSLAPDCVGTFQSFGYNLLAAIDSGDCSFTAITGDLTGTISSPLAANIDSLRFGCDPTPAVPLLLGSPALDGGDPAGCLGPGGIPLAFDQLGQRRVWDGPDPDSIARCDIGAFEAGAPVALIFEDSFETGDVLLWSQSLRRPGAAPLGGGCGVPE
ncbi:MAG: CSLREA domain-containing protein [Acidobacteriota bacterium]